MISLIVCVFVHGLFSAATVIAGTSGEKYEAAVFALGALLWAWLTALGIVGLIDAAVA